MSRADKERKYVFAGVIVEGLLRTFTRVCNFFLWTDMYFPVSSLRVLEHSEHLCDTIP